MKVIVCVLFVLLDYYEHTAFCKLLKSSKHLETWPQPVNRVVVKSMQWVVWISDASDVYWPSPLILFCYLKENYVEDNNNETLTDAQTR